MISPQEVQQLVCQSMNSLIDIYVKKRNIAEHRCDLYTRKFGGCSREDRHIRDLLSEFVHDLFTLKGEVMYGIEEQIKEEGEL